MSRFNIIEKPEYVSDFLYQPPWELIEKVAQKKQEDFSATMKSMDMLEGSLSIGYIPDSVEKSSLETIQKYYQDKIDNFNTNLLSNPNDYKKYLPDMIRLGKDINQDLKTGELSNIQGSYNAYQSWLQSDSVKKAQTEDPGLFETAKNKFLNNWRANPNRSQDALFTGQQLYSGKDFTAGLEKIIKELQPDLQKEGLVDTSGNWVTTTTKEQKQLAVNRINNLVMGKMMSDPTLKDYIMQRQSLGYNGYLDAEGNFISPLNEDGSPNAMSALGSAFQFGQAFAFNENTIDQKADANKFKIQANDQAHDIDMLNRKQQGDIEKLKLEYSLKEQYGLSDSSGSSPKDMMNIDQPEDVRDNLVLLNDEMGKSKIEKDEAFKVVTRPIYDLLVQKIPALGNEKYSVGSTKSMQQMVLNAKARGAMSDLESKNLINEIQRAEYTRDKGISASSQTALAGAIFHTMRTTTKGQTMSDRNLMNKSIKASEDILKSYNEKIKNPMSMVRETVRLNTADKQGAGSSTYSVKEFKLADLAGKTIDVKTEDGVRKVTFPSIQTQSVSGAKINSDFFVAGSVRPVVVSSNARNTFIQADVPVTVTKGGVTETITIPLTFKNNLEMAVN